MFKSLESMLNIPIIIKPYLKRSGTGDIQYGDDISTKCYAQDKIQVVVNNAGAEVVSNTQIYLQGSQSVNILDSILFEGRCVPIKSIGTFYWKGAPSIKVVYV